MATSYYQIGVLLLLDRNQMEVAKTIWFIHDDDYLYHDDDDDDMLGAHFTGFQFVS